MANIEYSYQQFEKDLDNLKPRVFDTYILPAYLMFYAYKSKKAIPRNARRVLFSSGVLMLMRNYRKYKEAARLAQEFITMKITQGENAS